MRGLHSGTDEAEFSVMVYDQCRLYCTTRELGGAEFSTTERRFQIDIKTLFVLICFTL